MLIILEGSSNCRLSCPILDEKEATKEEEPSKTLLRVKYQFPTKFFIKNKQARVKSEHEAEEAEEDEVADNPAEEAEESKRS